MPNRISGKLEKIPLREVENQKHHHESNGTDYSEQTYFSEVIRLR